MIAFVLTFDTAAGTMRGLDTRAFLTGHLPRVRVRCGDSFRARHG